MKFKKKINVNKFQVGQQLNSEQNFMQELFGNGQKVMFNNPNSECLPTMHGSLMPNAMGNEIDDGETTPNLFGWGSNRSTGGLFGI